MPRHPSCRLHFCEGHHSDTVKHTPALNKQESSSVGLAIQLSTSKALIPPVHTHPRRHIAALTHSPSSILSCGFQVGRSAPAAPLLDHMSCQGSLTVEQLCCSRLLLGCGDGPDLRRHSVQQTPCQVDESPRSFETCNRSDLFSVLKTVPLHATASTGLSRFTICICIIGSQVIQDTQCR